MRSETECSTIPGTMPETLISSQSSRSLVGHGRPIGIRFHLSFSEIAAHTPLLTINSYLSLGDFHATTMTAKIAHKGEKHSTKIVARKEAVGINPASHNVKKFPHKPGVDRAALVQKPVVIRAEGRNPEGMSPPRSQISEITVEQKSRHKSHLRCLGQWLKRRSTARPSQNVQPRGLKGREVKEGNVLGMTKTASSIRMAARIWAVKHRPRQPERGQNPAPTYLSQEFPEIHIPEVETFSKSPHGFTPIVGCPGYEKERNHSGWLCSQHTADYFSGFALAACKSEIPITSPLAVGNGRLLFLYQDETLSCGMCNDKFPNLPNTCQFFYSNVPEADITHPVEIIFSGTSKRKGPLGGPGVDGSQHQPHFISFNWITEG